jgi:anti-sigma B factor antagonist
MSDLSVETHEIDGVVLLRPRGFINAHTVRSFEEPLRAALGQGRYRIVVDCAALVYIASAGLGAIMGAIEEIREHGGDLRLSGLNETVANIFEILGFNHLYRIFASEAEALASFAEELGGAASGR